MENQQTEPLNDTLDQMDLSYIYIEHSIPKQLSTHSFQVHMEHSPGQITSWVTHQASVHLRKMKSYQASFLITLL